MHVHQHRTINERFLSIPLSFNAHIHRFISLEQPPPFEHTKRYGMAEAQSDFRNTIIITSSEIRQK